ncbi:MAG: nickel-responsive transcriptional regulator NikR [Rhodocyclaceae bacterium]|nr:nickel-responsive transcriptional regulator NikR [Rhodocyclaceae bacterium]MBX3669787.1 nickel-responsive transcriptional regulator NikR [Rhodocyclaceae bacterium]
MERFTISLDEDLAQEFDRLIAARGYSNRSEAMRDMLRGEIERWREERDEARYCVANLSYVYDHHERALAERLAQIQHDHHDLSVSTLHAHLDHETCLESSILRGPTAAVRAFAQTLMAERGVRHGALNVIAVDVDASAHAHPHMAAGSDHPYRHVHFKPKT